MPPLRIADGTLEAIKWLALVLMVMDHVNKWLYAGKLPWVFESARIVAPAFAFILAYNLSRPGALENGAFQRVIQRLALAGLLAAPPFMALIHHWWPLNIMFTLLACTVVLYGLLRDTPWWLLVAGIVFTGGGFLVEYFHPALLMFLAAWAYCQRPDAIRLLVWVACVASLHWTNHNLYALAAVPLLLAAPHVDLRLPRVRHVFYVAYPLHLAIVWAMTKGIW